MQFVHPRFNFSASAAARLLERLNAARGSVCMRRRSQEAKQQIQRAVLKKYAKMAGACTRAAYSLRARRDARTGASLTASSASAAGALRTRAGRPDAAASTSTAAAAATGASFTAAAAGALRPRVLFLAAATGAS